MSHRHAFLAFCVLAAAPALIGAESASPEPRLAIARKAITLEQTVGRGDRIRFTTEIPTYHFDAAGALVERAPDRTTRRLDPATLEPLPEDEGVPEASPRFTSDELAAAIANLEGFDRDRATAFLGGRRGVGFDDARGFARFAEGGIVHVSRRDDGSLAARIVEPLGDPAPEVARGTSDARRVLFVLENDLHVLDVDSGEMRALTESGSEQLLHGKLDWVYQEELYGRGDFTAHFAAPNGRHVAFLSLDQSPVHTFALADPIDGDHFRGDLELQKYPKAGDPNLATTPSSR
jgi:hypothetical protein